jgi:hypothetical protein
MCDSDNITGYTVVLFVSFTNNTTDATIRADNIDPSGAHRFDPDILNLKRCKNTGDSGLYLSPSLFY